VAPVPASAQLWSKLPELLVARAKLPLGVIGVPGEVSIVVTVHDEGVTTMTGVSHTTVVVVDLPSMPKLACVLVLPLCVESPP